MAQSDLTAIMTKVRRLTRSPSSDQLTDDQIKEYVNTVILYDVPSQLRLFKSRQTFTFWTIPNVAEYETNTTSSNNPLVNFQNKYITVHDPVYIGGYRAYFTQSRDEFFNMWPKVNSQQLIAIGDGVTTSFSNIGAPASNAIQSPMLQNNVTFSAISVDNAALTLHDVPIVDTQGNMTVLGNLYVPGYEPANPPTIADFDVTNYVNYLTGEYVVTFKDDNDAVVAPSGDSLTSNPSQNQIFCQNIPYLASIPTTILYFENKFTLRPVPQISYPVQMEVYVRPTELISTSQSPDIQQWWQYISFLAAKKIFEDRTDYDSLNLMMPALKEQELFVQRTTLVQEANERAATIYKQQTSLSAGPMGSSWWGGW